MDLYFFVVVRVGLLEVENKYVSQVSVIGMCVWKKSIIFIKNNNPYYPVPNHPHLFIFNS